jgi:MFS family permease
MPSCCTTNEIDRNWLIPVAAFFIHFVSLGMQYSLGLYFLPVSIEFNSNRGTTAWMGSLAMGLMLCCAFPAGYLMDVYDTRVLLALASCLLALGLMLASIAQSLPLLFLSIAVSGLACSIHIQAASTIQGWFDEKKGLATGVAMAGSGFGNFIFAIAIGTYLAARGTSTHAWREALRWEAMVVVLFSLPASLLLKKRKKKKVQGEHHTLSTPNTTVSFLSLVRDKRMVCLLLAKGFGSFGYGIPFVHLVPLMSDQGLLESEQSLALGLIGVASLCGRIILGAAGDRFGHVRLFAVGMFMLALGLGIMPHCRSATGFCLISFYYGFFAGGYPSLPPSIISLWFSGHPDHVGRLVGVNFCVDTLGAVVGPVVVGVMYDTLGNYVTAFTVHAGFLLVATIFACMMPPAVRRGKEKEDGAGGGDVVLRPTDIELE